MLLLAIDFDNLHQILQNLYVEMMPLCSKMTGVARGNHYFQQCIRRNFRCILRTRSYWYI